MAASTHTLPQTRRPAHRPQQADHAVNVGDLERWLSLLGGGSWPSPQGGARWERSCSGRGRCPAVSWLDRALCPVPDDEPAHAAQTCPPPAPAASPGQMRHH